MPDTGQQADIHAEILADMLKFSSVAANMTADQSPKLAQENMTFFWQHLL